MIPFHYIGSSHGNVLEFSFLLPRWVSRLLIGSKVWYLGFCGRPHANFNQQPLQDTQPFSAIVRPAYSRRIHAFLYTPRWVWRGFGATSKRGDGKVIPLELRKNRIAHNTKNSFEIWGVYTLHQNEEFAPWYVCFFLLPRWFKQKIPCVRFFLNRRLWISPPNKGVRKLISKKNRPIEGSNMVGPSASFQGLFWFLGA